MTFQSIIQLKVIPVCYAEEILVESISCEEIHKKPKPQQQNGETKDITIETYEPPKEAKPWVTNLLTKAISPLGLKVISPYVDNCESLVIQLHDLRGYTLSYWETSLKILFEELLYSYPELSRAGTLIQVSTIPDQSKVLELIKILENHKRYKDLTNIFYGKHSVSFVVNNKFSVSFFLDKTEGNYIEISAVHKATDDATSTEYKKLSNATILCVKELLAILEVQKDFEAAYTLDYSTKME